MIRKFLLTLLVACLAVPAAANAMHCVDTFASDSAGCHDAMADENALGEVPAPDVQRHACIGCIAPLSGHSDMAPVSLITPARAVPLDVTNTIRPRAGPDTPPPRT